MTLQLHNSYNSKPHGARMIHNIIWSSLGTAIELLPPSWPPKLTRMSQTCCHAALALGGRLWLRDLRKLLKLPCCQGAQSTNTPGACEAIARRLDARRRSPHHPTPHPRAGASCLSLSLSSKDPCAHPVMLFLIVVGTAAELIT